MQKYFFLLLNNDIDGKENWIWTKIEKYGQNRHSDGEEKKHKIFISFSLVSNVPTPLLFY